MIKVQISIFDSKHTFAPNKAEYIFNQLCLRFSLSDRHNHAPSHIVYRMQKLDKDFKSTLDEKSIGLAFMAIFFHDVIYDPKAKGNEEQSAQYFAKMS